MFVKKIPFWYLLSLYLYDNVFSLQVASLEGITQTLKMTELKGIGVSLIGKGIFRVMTKIIMEIGIILGVVIIMVTETVEIREGKIKGILAMMNNMKGMGVMGIRAIGVSSVTGTIGDQETLTSMKGIGKAIGVVLGVEEVEEEVKSVIIEGTTEEIGRIIVNKMRVDQIEIMLTMIVSTVAIKEIVIITRGKIVVVGNVRIMNGKVAEVVTMMVSSESKTRAVQGWNLNNNNIKNFPPIVTVEVIPRAGYQQDPMINLHLSLTTHCL